MKLKDVPQSPAYLVCHDHFDKGAMEVWMVSDIERAETLANNYNRQIDDTERCYD